MGQYSVTDVRAGAEAEAMEAAACWFFPMACSACFPYRTKDQLSRGGPSHNGLGPNEKVVSFSMEFYKAEDSSPWFVSNTVHYSSVNGGVSKVHGEHILLNMSSTMSKTPVLYPQNFLQVRLKGRAKSSLGLCVNF